MTGLLGLADDLTGALEIGALFGVPVITRADAIERESVVIDTETRHLTASEAREKLRGFLTGRYRLVYKKTDSTLRGNIGPELAALLQAFPGSSIFYAPAYPELGRTVRDGLLLIDGVPVSRTGFARDELNPVQTSDVAELLSPYVRACKVTVDRWTRVPGMVDVFDGATQADVVAVARLALRQKAPVIAAGPGALAGALSGPRPQPRMPRLERCLIVGGSRHAVSQAQVQWAREHSGWTVWDPPAIQGTGTEYAAATGRALLDVLWKFDGIIVFGGDTAYGLVAALDHPPLQPLGEVLAGIPVSRLEAGGRVMHLITKAGGFGPTDLIGQVSRRLNSEESG